VCTITKSHGGRLGTRCGRFALTLSRGRGGNQTGRRVGGKSSNRRGVRLSVELLQSGAKLTPKISRGQNMAGGGGKSRKRPIPSWGYCLPAARGIPLTSKSKSGTILPTKQGSLVRPGTCHTIENRIWVGRLQARLACWGGRLFSTNIFSLTNPISLTNYCHLKKVQRALKVFFLIGGKSRVRHGPVGIGNWRSFSGKSVTSLSWERYP